MNDRAQFEAYANGQWWMEGINLARDGDGYSDTDAQAAWEIWQAARAKPVVPDGYVLLPLQDAYDYMDMMIQEANEHRTSMARYRPARQEFMDSEVERVRSLLPEPPKNPA